MAPATNPPNTSNTQNQGGGGGGSENPGQILATQFSLTPGIANLGIIDYASYNGLNHWKGATTKLEEQLYDFTTDMFY